MMDFGYDVTIHPSMNDREEITDAHMTQCGHNACEHCIREALNRRHVCPICNTPSTQGQLVKNHAFDSLFRTFTNHPSAPQ
jgi:hypothetical protein